MYEFDFCHVSKHVTKVRSWQPGRPHTADLYRIYPLGLPIRYIGVLEDHRYPYVKGIWSDQSRSTGMVVIRVLSIVQDPRDSLLEARSKMTPNWTLNNGTFLGLPMTELGSSLYPGASDDGTMPLGLMKNTNRGILKNYPKWQIQRLCTSRTRLFII